MRAADHFYDLATRRGFALQPSGALPWLTGRGHLAVEADLPPEVRLALSQIFDVLDGDEAALLAKPRRSIPSDFLLGAIQVEFDEGQHFTIQRLATLAFYPSSVALGFERLEYARLCLSTARRAGRAFAHKAAGEFPGLHGRARQRAYFDAFRDLVAPILGNGPVLRVPAPDRDPVAALEKFEKMLSR